MTYKGHKLTKEFWAFDEEGKKRAENIYGAIKWVEVEEPKPKPKEKA